MNPRAGGRTPTPRTNGPRQSGYRTRRSSCPAGLRIELKVRVNPARGRLRIRQRTFRRREPTKLVYYTPRPSERRTTVAVTMTQALVTILTAHLHQGVRNAAWNRLTGFRKRGRTPPVSSGRESAAW